MSKKLSNILLGALLIIGLVTLVLFYIQSGSGMYKLYNLSNVLATSTSMLDVMMLWAYILVGGTLLLLVIFAVIDMIQNPKSLKKTGLTLVLGIVLVVISYFLASGAPVNANIAVPPSFATLKMTDTLLLLTYILFGVSVIVLCWGTIRKSIQK